VFLPDKYLNKFIFLCVILFFIFQNLALFSSVREENLPVRSSGQLAFDVDICQYQFSKSKTLVEISYSLNLFQLVQKHASTDSNAVLNVDLCLTAAEGESLAKVHERKVISLSDLRQKRAGYAFIDLKRFGVVPQPLTVKLTIKDSSSTLTGQVIYPLIVRKFTNEFSLSDLFFISHVQKATKKSVFEKHGAFLIPDPSRIFYVKGKNSRAFVYYEINNLKYDANSPSYYSVSYAVHDLTGKEIISSTPKTVLKKSFSGARIEMIPLTGFSTGVYQLTLTVKDLTSTKSQTINRYFQVYAEDENNKLLLPMSEQDIKKYFDQIKYIATDTEKKIFKKLSPRGKQEFLLNFWKSRDPTPGTPENEFMEEHFRRLAYCKAHFQGEIDSDMGRIYIKYGPPIDIQRNFSSIEYSKPVIIWTYALDGRSEFVFVDRSGDGNYVLVHSTYRDEYKNPNWMNDIKQMGNRR